MVFIGLSKGKRERELTQGWGFYADELLGVAQGLAAAAMAKEGEGRVTEV